MNGDWRGAHRAGPARNALTKGSCDPEGRHPVLAGYDCSRTSMRALAYAAGMARRLDRWLVVVHVSRLGGLASVPLTASAAEERLRRLRTELAGADLTGLDVEIIERNGDPARELSRVTAERNADAIVIGASARFVHRFTGSVSTWLARHASCPAVIVP
jgi:nucleotide-binding universal stress UspA family protein